MMIRSKINGISIIMDGKSKKLFMGDEIELPDEPSKNLIKRGIVEEVV